MGRKNGTVHGNSLLRKDLESPCFRGPDGESGRPESIDPLSRNILQTVDGGTEIFPELFRRLLPDQLVVLRMAANRILFGDPRHQVRIGPGYPADDEESGGRSRFFQETEQAPGVFVDPYFELFPFRFRPGRIMVQQVEPFFQVDSKDTRTSLFQHIRHDTCSQSVVA